VRVGIDARFITRHPIRGIGSYSLNLVAALVRLSRGIEFFLYIAAPDDEGILPLAANVTVRRLAMPAYPLWEQIALPLAAREDRLDILHCLGNTAPLVMPSSVRIVLTLHDVMFLQSGEFVPRPVNRYQALGRIYRRAVVPHCARAAAHVLTMSEYSRKDILQLVSGLDPACVSVTYQSCNAIYQKLPALLQLVDEVNSNGRPYIFALGADDPRKNTLRLVRAYLAVLQKYGIEQDLIVSGYSNWESSEAYRAVKNAGVTDRVKFLAFVSLEELAALYRSALLFVYPSLYEGFGIPVLEAFSSGCPVIASDVTSIPEVGGDSVIYVDPLSEEQIGQAMYRLIQNSELRQSLIERGHARALTFTWEETARQTLCAYERCTSEPVAA